MEERLGERRVGVLSRCLKDPPREGRQRVFADVGFATIICLWLLPLVSARKGLTCLYSLPLLFDFFLILAHDNKKHLKDMREVIQSDTFQDPS